MFEKATNTSLFEKTCLALFLAKCIFFYPYCLKDYRPFVQLKMAWTFNFAFLPGAWRGFGDGIGLHKAFLGCHGGVWKWKFLYWLSASFNIGTEDLLLIQMNFINKSKGNSPRFGFAMQELSSELQHICLFIFNRFLLVCQFPVVNNS